MRTMNLTINGDDYVAIPKSDFTRLIRGKGKAEVEREVGTIDALAHTRRALGRNLKAAREHAGLTQAQLADKLGKAQTTVSGSESGNIRVSEKYVANVLKACGLPKDWKAPSSTRIVTDAPSDFKGYGEMLFSDSQGKTQERVVNAQKTDRTRSSGRVYTRSKSHVK